jgi:hypothetical protein
MLKSETWAGKRKKKKNCFTHYDSHDDATAAATAVSEDSAAVTAEKKDLYSALTHP